MIPPLVTPFVLTLAISFLIGIGLREYYEGEGKFDTFGTVRTFVFIGMLGFMLYTLPEFGNFAFLLGLATLALFLLVYYNNKIGVKKSPGLIGVILAELTYLTAPVAIHQPHWFLVMVAVTILLVLHSKGRVRRFTDRLETGEVVTVCKFLAIAGVILPLTPAAWPAGDGIMGNLAQVLPVTPRQVWLAVVITTGISYLGYALQTYFFPRRGLLLTGIIGGVYSSTAAVLVLAKKSRNQPGHDREAAAAILLAVAMMYLRLLVLVAVFRFTSLAQVGPALLGLAALSGAYGLSIGSERKSPVAPPVAVPEPAAAPAGNGEVVGPQEPSLRVHPLELNFALLFAVMFVVISIATKYTLLRFDEPGLRVLSFIVGASDITPFVVSVLQGDLGIQSAQILQAIVIASASNNLMKLAYAYLFGSRQTANVAARGMGPLAVISIVYALVAF